MARGKGHGASPSASAATLLSGAVQWLLDNSVVLYLVAIASHRAWVLLNSDVAELLRRQAH